MRKTVFIFILYFAVCLMIPYLITVLMGGSCRGNRAKEAANTVGSLQDSESEITDVTDYIIRTVAAYYEAGDSAEFLKALSVVVRTYLKNTEGGGTGVTPAALVPRQLTYREMKDKWGDYYPAYYEAVLEAVNATEGITMSVQSGQMLPYFCILSAGYTRGIENSCLSMVNCSEDMQSPDYLSIVSFSQKDLSSKIKSCYPDVKYEGHISEAIQVVSRDEAGYITTIMIGNITLSGDELASCLGLNSGNFMITSGNDNIIFTVKGIGNGYGMSLYSARQKAAAGAGFEEILYYYYKNILLISE